MNMFCMDNEESLSVMEYCMTIMGNSVLSI